MSSLMTNNIYEYLRETKLRVEHMERRWVKTGLLDKINEKIFHVDENGKDTLKWIIRNGFGNIEDFLNKIDNVFNMQVDIIIKEEEEEERREKEKQQKKPEFFNKIFDRVTTYIVEHLERKITQDFLFVELPPRHLKTTLCHEVIKHLNLKEFDGTVDKMMLLNYNTYKDNNWYDNLFSNFDPEIYKKKLIVGNYGIIYPLNDKKEYFLQKSLGCHNYNSFDLIVIDDLQYINNSSKNEIKEMKNYIMSNIKTWLKPNGIVLFVNSRYVGINLTDLIREDLQQFTTWKYPAFTKVFQYLNNEDILWRENYTEKEMYDLKSQLGENMFNVIYLLRKDVNER
jgi:hypothetical protein